MQAYYRSVLGQDGPASPEERQALRHAMIDYGALQPSPVQKPNESSRVAESPVVTSSLSPTDHHTHVGFAASLSTHLLTLSQRKPIIANITNPSLGSPMPTTVATPSSYTPNFAWNTPPAVPPLEADETFNLDSFDLTNEELEVMMMNATQEFWASFPGEVGVGY